MSILLSLTLFGVSWTTPPASCKCTNCECVNWTKPMVKEVLAEPTVTYQQPTVTYQQPTVTYQQPTVTYQQPVIRGRFKRGLFGRKSSCSNGQCQ